MTTIRKSQSESCSLVIDLCVARDELSQSFIDDPESDNGLNQLKLPSACLLPAPTLTVTMLFTSFLTAPGKPLFVIIMCVIMCVIMCAINMEVLATQYVVLHKL